MVPWSNRFTPEPGKGFFFLEAIMRTEPVELTTMTMVTDRGNRILVQDRIDPSWPGVTFPGGHVEPGESFVEAAAREVLEETGLIIHDPILCGLKQWTRDGRRYVVLLFKATQFEGELHDSEEGRVWWLPRAELLQQNLASHMMEMVKVFETDTLSELYSYTDQDGTRQYKLL